MRLPNAIHESHPWRIRAIAHDFELEDVWALPAHGRADEFPRLIDLMASSDPAHADSRAARFLWRLRDRLGRRLDLGRIADRAEGPPELPIPGTDETSLAARLPDDLRGTAADVDFGSLPFVPLYLTDEEFAAEVSNKTVHGVLHLGWVKAGEDDYSGQMAVYVKPRGVFGQAYMAAIKPFRYRIYPALMRQAERTWNARIRG